MSLFSCWLRICTPVTPDMVSGTHHVVDHGSMETTSADTFGRTVAAARRAKGWTQAELADAADISKPTVQRLEKGAPVQPRTWKVHLAVAEALGWTRESVDAVWAGGEPALAEDDLPSESAGPSQTFPAGLSDHAKWALSSGRVVDSAVISASGDGGRMVVILVDEKREDGEEGTPPGPEKLQRDMERWERMQRVTREAYRIFSNRRDEA